MKSQSETLRSKLGAILEELHEKLLIGWIINDGKTHTMPSHGTDDGCTDESAQAIIDLFKEEMLANVNKVEAVIRPKVEIDKHDGGYNCCGCSTYYDIVDDFSKELRQAIEREM